MDDSDVAQLYTEHQGAKVVAAVILGIAFLESNGAVWEWKFWRESISSGVVCAFWYFLIYLVVHRSGRFRK
jgi:hypothetical protein